MFREHKGQNLVTVISSSQTGNSKSQTEQSLGADLGGAPRDIISAGIDIAQGTWALILPF